MKENQISKGVGEVGSIIMITVFFALVLGSILSIDIFTNIDVSDSVANDSAGYINATGYTFVFPTETDIAYTNVVILNATDNSTLLAGNYTVSAAGVLTNATAVTIDDVLISYDYAYESSSTLAGIDVNALSAIFAAFVVAVTAFIVIGGTLLGILWILPFIKPLFKRDALGMS